MTRHPEPKWRENRALLTFCHSGLFGTLTRRIDVEVVPFLLGLIKVSQSKDIICHKLNLTIEKLLPGENTEKSNQINQRHGKYICRTN